MSKKSITLKIIPVPTSGGYIRNCPSINGYGDYNLFCGNCGYKIGRNLEFGQLHGDGAVECYKCKKANSLYDAWPSPDKHN